MRRDKVKAARRRVAGWEEPQKSPRGADFDIGLTPDRRDGGREGGREGEVRLEGPGGPSCAGKLNLTSVHWGLSREGQDSAECFKGIPGAFAEHGGVSNMSRRYLKWTRFARQNQEGEDDSQAVLQQVKHIELMTRDSTLRCVPERTDHR